MTEKQTQQMRTSMGPAINAQMKIYLIDQIEADEQVLWAGTTQVSVRMRRLRFLIILSVFMMLFCSGTFLLMETPSKLFLVIMSILVWAGIPAFVVWAQSDHLRRTLYAVTDQRLLILSLGKPGKTESYPPSKIEFIRPAIKKDGRGDIYFTVLRGKGRQRHMRYNHGFLDIADAESVANLMRKTFPEKADKS